MRISWVLLFMSIVMQPASALANSAGAGRGVVHMNGSIIDTPCAIDMTDRDQTIDLGVTTAGQILHDGYGPPRPFSIRLINCLHQIQTKSPDVPRFQITLDGAQQNKFFGAQGASGLEIEIRDKAGSVAIPGRPMLSANIQPGNMRLDYVLRVVSNKQKLKAGKYYFVIRFKLDYL